MDISKHPILETWYDLMQDIEALGCGVEFTKVLTKAGDLGSKIDDLVGDLEITKLLLENGADVHAKGDEALCWAAYNGHTEVVKILLENGANVHAHDDYAISWAAYNGHTEVVKLLKEH